MRWALLIFHESILLLSLLFSDAIQSFLNSSYSFSLPLRAVVDNGAHGLIAFCSWNVVVLPRNLFDVSEFLPSCLCAFLACFIDVDHFLLASSWSLSAATSLDRRPPFHTSIPLVSLSAFVGCLRKYYDWETAEGRTRFGSGWPGWSAILGPMALVAVTTHHARDALRRGIWLWPFHSTRHTPPLPYPVVYAFTLAFPIFVSCFLYRRVAPAEIPTVEEV